MDISKYFREYLGIRDNESRLYFFTSYMHWGTFYGFLCFHLYYKAVFVKNHAYYQVKVLFLNISSLFLDTVKFFTLLSLTRSHIPKSVTNVCHGNSFKVPHKGQLCFQQRPEPKWKDRVDRQTDRLKTVRWKDDMFLLWRFILKHWYWLTTSYQDHLSFLFLCFVSKYLL